MNELSLFTKLSYIFFIFFLFNESIFHYDTLLLTFIDQNSQDDKRKYTYRQSGE